MKTGETVSGLSCTFDTSGSGFVNMGGVRIPEQWTPEGNAKTNRDNDMKDCLVRTRVPCFEDFRHMGYVRSAQNHRSAILFLDGYGVTIARKAHLVEIPYEQLSSYSMSADGVHWVPICTAVLQSQFGTGDRAALERSGGNGHDNKP